MKAARILFIAFPSIRTLKFRKVLEYANPLSSLYEISISTWNGTADEDAVPLLIAGATALFAYYFGTESIKNNLQLHAYGPLFLSFASLGIGYGCSFLSHEGRRFMPKSDDKYDI
jgi:hypothetical protein